MRLTLPESWTTTLAWTAVLTFVWGTLHSLISYITYILLAISKLQCAQMGLLCHNCLLYDYLCARVGYSTMSPPHTHISVIFLSLKHSTRHILISVYLLHKAENQRNVLVSRMASSVWHNLESPMRCASRHALWNYLDSSNWGRRYTHCQEPHHSLAIKERAVTSILCSPLHCRWDVTNCFKHLLLWLPHHNGLCLELWIKTSPFSLKVFSSGHLISETGKQDLNYKRLQ